MQKFSWIKSKKFLIIAAAVIVALLVILLLARPGKNGDGDGDPALPSTSQDNQNSPVLPDLVGTAKSIKNNLMSALEDIKKNRFDDARTKLNTVREDIATVRSFADKIPLLMQLIPQASNIYAFLDAMDVAIPEVLLPVVDLMEATPLSSLKVGDAFDVTVLHDYIDFADSVMPGLERLLKAANEADLSILDSEGKIEKYLEPLNNLVTFYQENPAFLPMLKQMLGAREDRLYLLAVQNPSEIRASGGFPGFMGLVRITEGLMTISDFESVTKFLASWTPAGVQITKEEVILFDYLSGMRIPRDSDLCPDFERVGEIWAIGYEAKNHESIDGVISITPHIVQRLLAATEDEITLFDGSVLNGENALRVLIHDIYFTYFNRQNLADDRYKVSDKLFAEAAKLTMKQLTSNISASRIMAYLPVMKECIADRTLMLWMKDEAEQAFVVEQGWSGGLNKDPENPAAGIYVNVVSASKMGWFLLRDTQVGERIRNADGSYTYPITVTFSNNITKEEIKAADRYISGGLGGAMYTAAYFFAPAGGSVDHFEVSTGQKISIKTYNGMTLGFMDEFLLKPGVDVTVTYTVTTAPGVETPLALSMTPTAQ